MDPDLAIFIIWAGGLLLFVVLTSARACYSCIREAAGGLPPPNEAAGGGLPPPNEAAAVHRTPALVRRILLQLDKVTYPRRNSLPASTSGGFGGRPSTTASTATAAAGTAASASASASVSVSEECAICLGQFDDGDRCSVMPICHHEFHRDCIANWLVARHDTCPLCRAKLQWSLASQDMV